MRVRTSGGFVKSPQVVEYAINGNIASYWDGGYAGSFARMTDSPTPGFRAKSAKGEVIFSLADRSEFSCNHSGVGWDVAHLSNPTVSRWYTDGDPSFYYLGGAGPSVKDDPNSYAVHSLSEWQAACTEAATKTFADVGNAAQSNTWESLAEAHKTVEMLRHPINTFLSFDRKFFYPGRSAAKSWLAYRYGIKPLISNVQEVLENLRKPASALSRITSRGASRLVLSRITNTARTQGATSFVEVLEKRQTSTFRGTILSEASLSALDYSGLSGKQLVALPWELVPYSFVADWFVNIGDFISASVPTPSWKSLGSCISAHTDISWTARMEGVTPISGYTFYRSPSGVITWQMKGWSRSSLPPPGLVVKSDFRSDSFTRVGDALALVGQVVMNRWKNTRF